MARPSSQLSVRYPQTVLAATVLIAVVVAGLYWAQAVLIPIALAVFLTFLLRPPTSYLQRHGCGHVLSVVLVVGIASLIVVLGSWIVGREVSGLVGDMPRYTDNVRHKVHSLRESSFWPRIQRLDQMLEEVSDEAGGALVPGPDGSVPAAGGAAKTPSVVVRPRTPEWLMRLAGFVPTLLGALLAGAFTIVLVIFMLLGREDLRNRFIRLVGNGRLTMTTRAVDDATHRISRFLLAQLLMNSMYGACFALGLWLIGVEYALLWGVLMALMRYVPYVGTYSAAALPILLSLFTSGGWLQPLLATALFALLEIVIANFIEPMVFGRSVGVSQVALLIMMAFWSFLWGPIGLMLSTPIAVCLVVLGRHVPQLEFLSVLLGDEPPLEPHVGYYQRLLARDQDEADDIVQSWLGSNGNRPEQIDDELLVPALTCAKRDRERDELTDADEEFVLKATREIVADAAPRRSTAKDGNPADGPPRARLLGLATRDDFDQLALELFDRLLDPVHWDVQIAPAEMLTGEQLAEVEQQRPAVICIASLPPGGLAQARYLCKRLRARFPDVHIVVGRWGLRGGLDQNLEQLRAAGADQVATTLLETRTLINGWLPVVREAQGADRDRPASGGTEKVER